MRCGLVRQGEARQSRRGVAWFDGVGYGEVRSGKSGLVEERHGAAGEVWQGEVLYGMARCG